MLTTNYAYGVDYTSQAAINSIAGISGATASYYINSGAAAAMAQGRSWGCTLGVLTNTAVNSFVANVNATKNSVNTRISQVRANKQAQYNQYQAYLAWVAAEAARIAAEAELQAKQDLKLKLLKPPFIQTRPTGIRNPSTYPWNNRGSSKNTTIPLIIPKITIPSPKLGGSSWNTSIVYWDASVGISPITAANTTMSVTTNNAWTKPVSDSLIKELYDIRPKNIQANVWETKYIADELKMYKGIAKGVSATGKAVPYLGVALNTGVNIYDNVQNGVSADWIVTDAITDVGLGVGTVAGSTALGAAIGSIVPGPGTLIGACVGLLAGLLIDAARDSIIINGKSFDRNAKDMVHDAIMTPSIYDNYYPGYLGY